MRKTTVQDLKVTMMAAVRAPRQQAQIRVLTTTQLPAPPVQMVRMPQNQRLGMDSSLRQLRVSLPPAANFPLRAEGGRFQNSRRERARDILERLVTTLGVVTKSALNEA